MTKTEILNYIEKLMERLETAERKNYVISTSLNRMELLLKQYNTKFEDSVLDMKIEELGKSGESDGYGGGQFFQKDKYCKLMKEIYDIVDKL